ncbi:MULTISPECIES: rhomboid-like protein [unclassified Mycolicibacterium]|uniref:rhomboid-like protein n=1 Tax=unclassified Mycolicibacterium TaxID=2636767 RepID=UPI00192E3C82|nr:MULTISPECIES: rhomboid-like protein [unclassified Mycolicibacterium]MUM05479.1 hypothetical protein [Mycolicibacterium sp. CBMA 213]
MPRWLLRVPVTLTYAVLLIAATVAFRALEPRIQDRVLAYTSTNLHNLAHGHISTLLSSAFIADDGLFFLWLPGFICLLAAVELLWRSRLLLVVFCVGHVVTTLVVDAGLVLAVEAGWLPLSISRVADVGVSYGVMAVVGALTAAVPAALKPVWLGWWLAGAAAVLAVSSDFTEAGHVVAFGLGLLISTRLPPPVRWTRGEAVVFGVGVCFGYAVLVHTPELVMVGLPASALGAIAAALVTWRYQAKASPRASAQSRRHDSDG